MESKLQNHVHFLLVFIFLVVVRTGTNHPS